MKIDVILNRMIKRIIVRNLPPKSNLNILYICLDKVIMKEHLFINYFFNLLQ